MSRKVIFATLTFLALCSGSISVTRADPITLTPLDEVTEVMMDAQGANATFIARLFGADNGSLLSFTSNVDVVGRSFSYSTVPGLTYQGQPINITTSGQFNTTSGSWVMSSSGSLGGTTWSGTGSGMIIGDPEGRFNWVWVPTAIPVILDYQASVTYEETPIRTSSLGAVTLTAFGVPVGTATSRDVLLHQGPNAGQWRWVLVEFHLGDRDIAIDSEGANHFPNGGQGAFTTRIQAVPEPGTLILLGTGVAGVALRVRRRRRGIKDKVT